MAIHSNIYSHVADEESPDYTDNDSSEETPPFKSGQSNKKYKWIKNKKGPRWATREDDFECSKKPYNNFGVMVYPNYKLCTAKRYKRNFCHKKCNDKVCNRNTSRKERCQSENVYGARQYMIIQKLDFSKVKYRCGTCKPITNNAWIVN